LANARLLGYERAMSIFDPNSGMNPLPWIQEKSLRALDEAVRLVDLANESDTSEWYSKELKRRASGLIQGLAPLVALFNNAGEAAASSEEWGGVKERGTFALAAWCKKFDIQDPTKRAFNLIARERDDDDLEAKVARPADVHAEDEDDLWVLDRRCTIYSSLSRRVLHEDLTEPARRLLLWAMADLGFASRADVVGLSRRFLPTDVGATPEETLEAYRLLYDRGLVERVEDEDAGSDRLLLRLVAEGVNDSKQPLPFKEEKFGFPGARINGQPTTGNVLRVPLDGPLGDALSRWRFTDEDRRSLESAIQRQLGHDRVYVEVVNVMNEHAPALEVKLRYMWEDSDAELTASLRSAALQWARERCVKAER
jgi:hypothetical protein